MTSNTLKIEVGSHQFRHQFRHPGVLAIVPLIRRDDVITSRLVRQLRVSIELREEDVQRNSN
jgi:hypothetical protein